MSASISHLKGMVHGAHTYMICNCISTVIAAPLCCITHNLIKQCVTSVMGPCRLRHVIWARMVRAMLMTPARPFCRLCSFKDLQVTSCAPQPLFTCLVLPPSCLFPPASSQCLLCCTPISVFVPVSLSSCPLNSLCSSSGRPGSISLLRQV